MDMIAAYREVGTYRGAAGMCGCDPKTIKRALVRLAAGDVGVERKEPNRNYDVVAGNTNANVETPGANFVLTRPWANFIH